MNTAFVRYEPKASNNSFPEYKVPDNLKYPTSDGSMPDENDFGLTATDLKAPDVPIRLVPHFDSLKGTFKMIQQWEGRVVEFKGSEFTAIIIDKTNPDNEDLFVSVDTEDITPSDMPLIKSGAIFYWSIGFYDYPGRGRSRESRIRFRRLVGPSKEDIARSKDLGKKLAQFFESNSSCSSETR